MKNLMLLLACLSLFACTNESDSDNLGSTLKQFTTEQEAVDASPSGQACHVSGEYKEVVECVPTNRGKNGRCEDRTIIIDTRIWEVAYFRGDVDYNGTVGDRDDAQLATKKLYVKQLDNQPCPAAADIAPFEGIHDSFEPDGYFTSNDINKWREVKRTGQFPLSDVICESKCQVINHMAK